MDQEVTVGNPLFMKIFLMCASDVASSTAQGHAVKVVMIARWGSNLLIWLEWKEGERRMVATAGP